MILETTLQHFLHSICVLVDSELYNGCVYVNVCEIFANKIYGFCCSALTICHLGSSQPNHPHPDPAHGIPRGTRRLRTSGAYAAPRDAATLSDPEMEAQGPGLPPAGGPTDLQTP